MTKKTLKLALEVYELKQSTENHGALMCAIKEALANHIPDAKKMVAQPEHEPSYWLGYGLQAHTEKPFEGATPVYTTPPQRTWVGLTDEETETLIHRFDGDPHTLLDEVNARLKEKNT